MKEKNIVAREAFAIASAREVGDESTYHEISQEDFCQFIRHILDEMFEKCEPWKAVGKTIYYHYRYFIETPYEQIEKIGTDLGFLIRKADYEKSGFCISIPNKNEPEFNETSWAQKELTDFNERLAARVFRVRKIAKGHAEQACDKIKGKLMEGKFASKKISDNAFQLRVYSNQGVDTSTTIKPYAEAYMKRAREVIRGIDCTLQKIDCYAEFSYEWVLIVTK